MRHVMKQSAKYGDAEQVHVPNGTKIRNNRNDYKGLIITLIRDRIWYGRVTPSLLSCAIS